MKLKRILLGGLAALVVLLAGGFFLLPYFLDGRINRVADHEPYDIPLEITRLHQGLVVADLHADTLLWIRDPLDRADDGHVDLPRLIDGNVALQVFSVVTKVPMGQNYEENDAGSDVISPLSVAQRWPARAWTSLYERAIYQAGKLDDAERRSEGRLAIVHWREDLQAVLAARAQGRDVVGGLLAMEGAHPLEGGIAHIEDFYRAGYRMIGLHHFFDNELGGSLHGKNDGGLTAFGREVLRAMEERRMIVDLAHSSPAVVTDVLEAATRPVVISHTGVKGACDSPRNISDELMQQVAAAGGLVGIGYWKGAVCDASPAGIVKAIRYAIDLLGEDHVALGSDFDGAVGTTFDVSELAVLTREMMEASFTRDEISKVMGGNIIRFMRENLPPKPAETVKDGA